MKIAGLTFFRFDKDYLEDWKRNLNPLCDGFIAIYDKDGGFMYDEGHYRQKLYQRAFDEGYNWAVVLDPDERIETRGAKRLRKIIKKIEQDDKKVMFKVAYRELYSPKCYRVDGIWGNKERICVFPLLDSNVYSDASLHMPKHPLNEDYEIIDSGINVYHLKHIDPRLRVQRRNLYNKLDPEHQFQEIGYDYLTDETDIQLEKIPLGRRYAPKYRHYLMDDALFDL